MSDLIEKLRDPKTEGACWCCQSAADEIERCHEALKTCRQALSEVSHAQQCGPEWYTKGESGLRNQVRMWIDRGSKAIREVLDADADGGVTSP